MAVTKNRTSTKRKTVKRAPKRVAKKVKRTTKRSSNSVTKSSPMAKLLAYIKKMSNVRCANGHKRQVVRRKLCVKASDVKRIQKMLRGRGNKGPMVIVTTATGRKCIHYVASGCKQ